MEEKNARLQALIEGIIYKLAPITNVYNVYVDENTTLAKKLSEIITSLNGKAKSDDVGDVSELITEAKDSIVSAINEVYGKIGAPIDENAIYQIVAEYLTENPPSGIHIGADAPVDENIQVWIDTDEQPEENDKPDSGISWSETGEVVLLPETEFTFVNNQSMRVGYLEIVPGNTYTVSFDGTKYQCVAFETQYPSASYYFPFYGLGNAAIMGGGANTGEPFLFCSGPTTNMVMAIAADTKTVHTVGVTYTGTKYVPIPDGCIQKDYIVNIAGSGSYTADKTAKEVAQAAFSGKNVYAIHRTDASNGNHYRRYTLCYMLTKEPEDDNGELYMVKFIGLDLDDMMLLTMKTDKDGVETITIAAVTI